LGNIVRGVPLDAQGTFALALFTNFRTGGNVGILDWYTLSVAVFLLVTFAAHGATGLALKTAGRVHDRSIKTATLLWKMVFGLLAVITVGTWRVRPDFFTAMLHQPFGWLGLLGVGAGCISILEGLKTGRESRALIGSSSFIAGLMIAGAAGVFPYMLRSTIAPEYSLSAYRTASDAHGLAIAIVWWPIALVFALGYFWFIYRNYRGKVRPSQDTQIPY
jgi:cytochrome bd ubiquinol oxidase subunit II